MLFIAFWAAMIVLHSIRLTLAIIGDEGWGILFHQVFLVIGFYFLVVDIKKEFRERP